MSGYIINAKSADWQQGFWDASHGAAYNPTHWNEREYEDGWETAIADLHRCERAQQFEENRRYWDEN